MHSQGHTLPTTDGNPQSLAGTASVEQDLGPLAWVLEELRKTLDGAIKNLRRFGVEAQEARGGELDVQDAATLRTARQQLHQVGGALVMVGMPPAAQLLQGMEALAQRWVQKPDSYADSAIQVLERASFALLEYLDTVLAGKPAASVALFPQYREVQALLGNDKVHPADLWSVDLPRQGTPLGMAVPATALAYGPQARALLEQSVLQVVKTADPVAAAQMRDTSLGLALGAPAPVHAVFWQIAAGFLDALAHRLLEPDVYLKRVASRILMQYAQFSKGDGAVQERLLKDMLFFCAQAGVAPQLPPVLQAVYTGMGLQGHVPVEYEVVRFGRFDPSVLVQARKRIAAATEHWSALVGGDKNKLKPSVDQFSLVCDSLQRLQPGSGELAQALTRVMQHTVQRAESPSAAVGMEVATAVLYLQAAFASQDLGGPQVASHAQVLAARLQHALAGEAPQPLEPWMEELYRQASDAQTMGSVVGELRGMLGETEKVLDQFFRQPTDVSLLSPVSGYLSQMRGVLSVLGLDQAALAMARMREAVENLVQGAVPPAEQPRIFERLGNSLGALGFLIDMLSYQRAMARKLFVYDEQSGELRPLMGRSRAAEAAPESAGQAAAPASVVDVPAAPAWAPQPLVPPGPAIGAALTPSGGDLLDLDFSALQSPADIAASSTVLAPPPGVSVPSPLGTASGDGRQDEGVTDGELQDIFLEEARDVVTTGRAALQALAVQPAQLSEQTTLRRAFHTLKGSSRMVGLEQLGQAAWSLEQMLNAWLAEQQAMPAPMQSLAQQALTGFEAWIEAIATDRAQHWQALPFCVSADAMRLQSQWLSIDMDAVRGDKALAVPVHAPPPLLELPTLVDVASDADVQVASGAAVDGRVEAESPEDVPSVTGQSVDFSEFEAAMQASGQAKPSAPLREPAMESSMPDEVPALAPTEVDTLGLMGCLASTDATETLPVHEAPVAAERTEPPLPEGMRQVGDLRLPEALFTIFLGEAEEWSCQLQAALQAWEDSPEQPQPVSAVVWAHGMAGSSSTVGFHDLSTLARALEHALMHLQSWGGPVPAALVHHCTKATEEIRRLLHQFAAGFLRSPQPQILEGLQAVLNAEAAAPAFSQTRTSAETAMLVLPMAADSAMHTPHTPAFAGPLDADIDVLDVIDPDLFPIFEEEAIELLPAMGAALRQWAAQPGLHEARNTVLRALHTLKGSARLAGAMRLGEMAHRLESLLEPLEPEQVTTADIEPLLLRVDSLQDSFDRLRAVGAQGASEPVVVQGSASMRDAAALLPALALPSAQAGSTRAQAAVRAPVAARAQSQQTVRVRSQLLDRLINEAGEVMIARSRLDARMGMVKSALSDLGGNLERLRQQLRDLEVQAESQMQSRMAFSKDVGSDFDPLEFDRFTRVQELTRMMAESVNDVATVQRNLQREVTGAEDDLVAQGRQARELQRDLLRTRMVEFDSVAERLYAVVRGAAKETGKQVKLDIDGGTIEMDRGVLERMAPAFEHLLRNCVGHGIELPADRTAAGKPAQGTIAVQVQQEGNDVAVAFHDDGAGLDVARIREKALAQGLVTAQETVDGARAAQLIFMPGFTTAAAVTGLSGRGIGMDVVRSEVQALGGRIETETAAGQGSTFRLVLPLTTAVTQVLMLRAGDFSMGVPANLVETVRRVGTDELEAAYQTGMLGEGDAGLPFYWAGAVWQQSARSSEAGVGRTRPVMILRSAAQRIALHVDEVLGNQEVVIKHLGPQMVRLPGLTGMSVLPSGAVVLIYNPVALTAVYAERIRTQGLPADPLQPGTPLPVQGGISSSQSPLVMVVDDSITVRRVTQRLLQREGYRVVMAADGLQALEKLEDELPCVVLSDIEMPRMDGFDLARNIRADARLQHLPLVMITSRTADKHREHAMALGANHYLGKPYRDEELMNLVHHYASAVAQVPEACGPALQAQQS